MNNGFLASWANGVIGDDPADVMRSFENSLPVRLIATPREQFKTCTADENLTSVVERNRADSLDFLPVTEPVSGKDIQSDRIIGVIELIPFQGAAPAPADLVSDHMRPLSEDNLIGADAGILTFIRSADRQPFRLVVSGLEINGLVSLSDLQRLPVRAALFAMVTHLEITMAHAIRREFNHSEEWIGRLLEARRSKIYEEIAEVKSQDVFVDTLLFTQFIDKVTIIMKSPAFQWNNTPFESELRRVQKLRDSLAHANNYAATRGAAIHVCEIVRLTDQWISRLATWPTRLADPMKDNGS